MIKDTLALPIHKQLLAHNGLSSFVVLHVEALFLPGRILPHSTFSLVESCSSGFSPRGSGTCLLAVASGEEAMRVSNGSGAENCGRLSNPHCC